MELIRLRYEDIKKFDKTIDYMIGKGGNNISGGQKQRIAIARTLVKQNKFIVFDDSLSKLDTRTKLNILNNIIKMKIGTIIISHDSEIVKKCDKVSKASKTDVRGCRCRKAADEESPGFTGQDAG